MVRLRSESSAVLALGALDLIKGGLFCVFIWDFYWWFYRKGSSLFYSCFFMDFSCFLGSFPEDSKEVLRGIGPPLWFMLVLLWWLFPWMGRSVIRSFSKRVYSIFYGFFCKFPIKKLVISIATALLYSSSIPSPKISFTFFLYLSVL